MKKLKQFLGNCLYYLIVFFSIFFVIVFELISILYNFLYNLFRFRKISKDKYET